MPSEEVALEWARSASRRRSADKKVLLMCVDGSRKVGRPRKRWEDDIVKFFMDNFGENDWIHVAKCRETWAQLEGEFLNSIHQ